MGYCSICGKTIEQAVGLCEECKSKNSGEDYMDALLKSMSTSEEVSAANVSVDGIDDGFANIPDEISEINLEDVLSSTVEDVLSLSNDEVAVDDVNAVLDEMAVDDVNAVLDEVAVDDDVNAVLDEILSIDTSGDEALEDLFSHSSSMDDDGELEDIDMDEFDIDSLLKATDDIELPSIEDMMNADGLEELDALLAADEEKYAQDNTRETPVYEESVVEMDDPNAMMSAEAIEALFAQMAGGSDAIEDEPEGETDAQAESEPELEAQAESEPELDAQVELEPELYEQEEPEPELYTEAEPEPELDAQAESESELYTEAEPEPELYTEAESEPELYAQEDSETDAGSVQDSDLDFSFEDIVTDDTDVSESHDDLDDLDIDGIDLMSLLTADDDAFEMMFEDSPEQENTVSDTEQDKDASDDHLTDTTYTKDGRANVDTTVVENDLDTDIYIDDDLLKLEEDSDEGQSMADIFSDALSALSSEQDEEEPDNNEMAALLDNVRVNTKKKKKGGIKEKLKKLFGNIVDEKEIEKAKVQKEEAIQAEKNREEEEQKKKEKAEADKLAKQEAKEAKAKEKEEKKQIKAEKKKAKKEAKELKALEEAEEIEGRINKVGASIVFVVLGIMGAFIFFGTGMFSYSNSIKNAQTYFDNGDYSRSYKELLGVDIKEDDEALYQKVITVMHVYKQLEAYDAYYKESKYPEALDSLLKGIREYEKYMPDAVELDVTADLESVKAQIITEMEAEFGITEDMAKEINQITDSVEYSRRVYDLAQNLALNMQMSIDSVICYKKEELL